MSILIVGEKPSVSRAISSVVGADKVQKGYTEGNGYIVSWCVGHLVGLKYPKEYLSADRDLVLKMAEIMKARGMQFSGRVYPSGKGTLTVSHADLFAVRNIRDEVVNMRKQFASPDKAQEVGNRDYRANRDTHYYMSKLTPDQFGEVKPFLETSVSYHAVVRDGKVAFAVDKENAPAFHRALENAVRETNMLRKMTDLGLSMEQNIALYSIIIQGQSQVRKTKIFCLDFIYHACF